MSETELKVAVQTAGRIMVVDDDPNSQRLMAQLLGKDGYELVFAPNGGAAIEAAMHKTPDVILLDVIMPQMDGFEVCRHLRLDPLLAEVPIILVTSLGDRASRLRGLEAGADDFISKPVDGVELKTRVGNIVQLDRYRKLLHERARAQRAEASILSTCEATLEAYARILERDGRAKTGRCDRVLRLALSLAQSMKMTEADLLTLRWSVLLQAIAAMAVPLALRKEDRAALSGGKEPVRPPEQWFIETLSPIPALRGSLAVLACQHEQWDGSGHPRGLKGDAIPLAARILAVALACESEVSGDEPEAAARLAAIKAQAARRFDPRVIETLERVRPTTEARGARSEVSPATAALPRDTPSAHAPLSRRFSLVMTGARAQFAAAMALISVIPLLAMVYVCVSGRLGVVVALDRLWPAVAMALPFVALGYWMMVKYPINIVRLRRYMEDLARGVLPGHVVLMTDEDDLATVEVLLRKVVKQTETRVRTIEAQSEALLDAERQRVMVQSLGAACHHLGQPVTVIGAYLDITRRLPLPPEAQRMLADCQAAADAMGDILNRFQRLTVYRTESYLQDAEGVPGSEEKDRIIRVDCGNECGPMNKLA